MKEIILGYKVLVDDEDFDKVNQVKWSYSNGYAINDKLGRMHRYLLDYPIGIIDHINGNPLDNRRNNLRTVTATQNCYNRKKRKNCSSIYKGVRLIKSINKWRTEITYNKKQLTIGNFLTERLAALAYDDKAKELFGEYANLNFN